MTARNELKAIKQYSFPKKTEKESSVEVKTANAKTTTAKLQDAFSSGTHVASQLLKKTGNILKHSALLAYNCSPINFSSVTGYAWPQITRLTGDPSGQFLKAQCGQGRGIWPVAKVACGLAVKDPRGLSYFWMAYKRVLVVTHPWDIKQVFFNDKKTKRGIIFETFDEIYGHDNFLSMQSSDEQRRKRNILINYLFTLEGLEELVPEVERVVDAFISQNVKPGENILARQLFLKLTMNAFSQAALRTGPIPGDQVVRIESDFRQALNGTLDPWNFGKIKLAAILDYIHLKLKFDSIERPKANLHSILRELVLAPPNAEKIRESESLLIQLARLEQKPLQDQKEGDRETLKLDTPLMLADLATLLFAGHDTTTWGLQFLFVLLADHPLIMEKLYQEIDKHRPQDNKWTKEAIDRVVYLRWVFEEMLRLYPVVGFSLRTVTERFLIAKMPSCTTEGEYKEALKNRPRLSKSEDIELLPGDQLLFAPIITHRALFPRGDEFIPERHDPKHPLYIDKSFRWLPFTFGKRDCPGRNFAFLEVALTVIHVLDMMKKQGLRLEVNQHHPLDFYVHGTLQLSRPLQFRFVPIDPSNEEKAEPVRRAFP